MSILIFVYDFKLHQIKIQGGNFTRLSKLINSGRAQGLSRMLIFLVVWPSSIKYHRPSLAQGDLYGESLARVHCTGSGYKIGIL